MSYEVVKDRVDYTWVLTQQIERIAQAATRYFKTPAARREQVLAELKGAVQVLLDLADPVLEGGVDGEYETLRRARSYHDIMAVYRRVAKRLAQAGLLLRKSGLEDEAGGLWPR